MEGDDLAGMAFCFFILLCSIYISIFGMTLSWVNDILIRFGTLVVHGLDLLYR